MVQKVLSLSKILILIVVAILVTSSIKTTRNEGEIPSSLVVSTKGIPKDTVLISNENLTLNNDVYYLNKKAYSGYIKEMYSPKQVKCLYSFLNGQQQCLSKVYYLNGVLKESRSYKKGKSFGKQYGYWENGKPKFEFIYIDDRRESLQKQWYESGGKYTFLIFKNDREDGMQKAWRENGKPYINYEVKDGHKYGLEKTNLCYSLRNEKIITKNQ